MTPAKRVEAAPRQVLDDLARLDAVSFDSDGLLLVGRRHQRDNNSWMHNTARLTKGRARHQLLMHPDDLVRARRSSTGPSSASPRRSARSRSRCRPART